MEEIECGSCDGAVAGLARSVKRVWIVGPDGPITLSALCALAAKERWQAEPEAIFKTVHAMHGRPGGSKIALRLLPGYVFTVIEDEVAVRQPVRFDGDDPEAAGWTEGEFGWRCPTCAAEAEIAEAHDAGTAGLADFFEEIEDMTKSINGRCACCGEAVATAGCLRCNSQQLLCGNCSCVLRCGCGAISGCACPLTSASTL